MKVYCYDNEGIFTYVENAQIDPLESQKEGIPVYLVPANATILEPYDVAENEVNCFNGISWSIKKDYRGKKLFNFNTDEISEIKNVGDLEEGCFIISDEQILQMNEYTNPEVDDGKLVMKPSVDKLREYKIKKINEARESARKTENVEFDGDLFEIDETSVSNLSAMMAIAMSYPENVFLYRSKSNINHMLPSSKLIKLGSAVVNKVEEIYKKSWDLKEAAAKAGTVEKLLEISW